MKTVKLHSAPFLDSPGHGYASCIDDFEQLKICHTHDYFEIFLVDRGSADHFINGSVNGISTGFLCFIRPADVHYYDNCSRDFRIINIIVPETTINALFAFLGEGFEKERLLEATCPPSVFLDHNEHKALMLELEQIIVYQKIMMEKSDSAARINLFSIMIKYFPLRPLAKGSGPIPQWLRWLSLEILKAENFTKGLSALYWLSGKSPEHLSRACKKYLHKTPSKLVNDIRLEHAAKLLVTTDKSILEIHAECGFDSLSYFYHRFKEHSGTSPSLFKKTSAGKNIQIYRLDDLSIKAEIPKSIPLAIGETDSGR